MVAGTAFGRDRAGSLYMALLMAIRTFTFLFFYFFSDNRSLVVYLFGYSFFSLVFFLMVIVLTYGFVCYLLLPSLLF